MGKLFFYFLQFFKLFLQFFSFRNFGMSFFVKLSPTSVLGPKFIIFEAKLYKSSPQLNLSQNLLFLQAKLSKKFPTSVLQPKLEP